LSRIIKRIKRIDRLVEFATNSFGRWLSTSTWRGKEHDCVNIFVMEFLIPLVSSRSAIKTCSQIRIEGGVRQPSGFTKISARKDVVIWGSPFEVAWNSMFEPVNTPRVVMEWKTLITGQGKTPPKFDEHDQDWLEKFTIENPNSLGYLVVVDLRGENRLVMIGRVRRGITKQIA
jgi:hypothetical protein